jgi:hypothetical protein
MSDESNKDFSAYVYKVGKESEITIGKNVGNNKFQILAIENDITNSMQAMAVAPVESNGEVEI